MVDTEGAEVDTEGAEEDAEDAAGILVEAGAEEGVAERGTDRGRLLQAE